jgi:hypothetical protein
MLLYYLIEYYSILYNSSEKMEGTLLPSIQEMYSFTKKNHDMTVARNYEETTKRVPNKQIPTKRQHYLDDCIRYSCSPGPASNDKCR